MYSLFGSGFFPSYSAAKGALVQLTKSMAIELAPFNIQVNAIAPGWIETNMTAPMKAEAPALYQEIITRTPAGRFGNPDECAGTALFWRPEHPILLPLLPSVSTAIIPSGEILDEVLINRFTQRLGHGRRVNQVDPAHDQLLSCLKAL
jgi:NAD(P)-dependent dehydrogenase (short-subunit alcohol dehydrogenase family)